MDELTGDIFVIDPFDRESMTSPDLSFAVEASNLTPLVSIPQDTSIIQSLAKVSIEIFDINDNPPIFSDAIDTPIIVHWDLKPGSHVFQVEALDTDRVRILNKALFLKKH